MKLKSPKLTSHKKSKRATKLLTQLNSKMNVFDKNGQPPAGTQDNSQGVLL